MENEYILDDSLREAIEQIRSDRMSAIRGDHFPFFDKTCCWNPDEFFQENMIAIEQGFTEEKLENRLCNWLGKGRIALLYEEKGLFFAVRQLDEKKMIHWRFFNIRHLPFTLTIFMPKTKEELIIERVIREKKLIRAQEYIFDENSDEEEEQEEITVKINPLKEISLLKIMKKSPFTRRFYGRTFKPTFSKLTDESLLNTFCGFRWSKEELIDDLKKQNENIVNERVNFLKDHLFNVVCNKREDTFIYLLSWMTKIFLEPWERMHTMIILIGKQGCGKGSTMSIFGYWFGNHYRRVSTLTDLIGQFNSTAKDTILAFADEVSISKGSNEIEKLKMLITEEKGALRLEQKRQNTIYVDNFINLVGSIDTLDNFQVNMEERRYFPIYFDSAQVGDKEYFNKLSWATEADDYLGTRGLLLWSINNLDLSNFSRGQKMPETKELSLNDASREFNSKDIFEEWILKLIDRGYTLPQSRLDDNIDLNDDQFWLDDQGRSSETKNNHWICEISATSLYDLFRSDMKCKLSDSQIKKGLKEKKFLHQGCIGENSIRRRIHCSSTDGKITMKRRTYLTLLRCEEYMKLLDIDDHDTQMVSTEN